jgi:8-oxo-dGTP pyrophosphatase MutT (NUDIX family)
MNKERRMVVKAGGGLVKNEKGEILFMFRRGKWDLPKGKQDPGESLENCALREVEEETGVGSLTVQKFLLVTEHPYEEKGQLLLKETHWWLMTTNSQQPLVPQTEEDITELRWIGTSEMNMILLNTYPGIIEVLKAGGVSMKV